MRRIALYSDIHANTFALDAVYADISAAGVRERYCLGDLVGYGADPTGVIERVRASGDPVVQGNYDRGVGGRLGDCGCYYADAEARASGEASYAFTSGAVGDADAAWLAALPPEIRLEHEGARILLCHGSPRRVNEYLMPDRSDAQLARLASEAQADLVCVGHVHLPYHRSPAAGVHYVSCGSAGKPKGGDPRACWAELVLGEEGEVTATGDAAAAVIGSSQAWVGVVFHRVPYDVDAAVSAIQAAGLPDAIGAALRLG